MNELIDGEIRFRFWLESEKKFLYSDFRENLDIFMSREIKFRAWDTKNHRWLDHVPEREYMLDEEAWDHRDMDEAGGIYPKTTLCHYSFNNRIIFQQYTGVKDKNGKEIYEGDIIQKICHKNFFDITGYLEKFEVRWVKEVCGFRCVKKLSEHMSRMSEINNLCEVVGNIYEYECEETMRIKLQKSKIQPCDIGFNGTV